MRRSGAAFASRPLLQLLLPVLPGCCLLLHRAGARPPRHSSAGPCPNCTPAGRQRSPRHMPRCRRACPRHPPTGWCSAATESGPCTCRHFLSRVKGLPQARRRAAFSRRRVRRRPGPCGVGTGGRLHSRPPAAGAQDNSLPWQPDSQQLVVGGAGAPRGLVACRRARQGGHAAAMGWHGPGARGLPAREQGARGAPNAVHDAGARTVHNGWRGGQRQLASPDMRGRCPAREPPLPKPVGGRKRGGRAPGVAAPICYPPLPGRRFRRVAADTRLWAGTAG